MPVDALAEMLAAKYDLIYQRDALGEQVEQDPNPNEGFAKDPSETILLDLGHLHYFTFRQVEILYRLAGFQPERRLGIGKPFGRLRTLWPSLLSGQVCVSGTFQGKMP